MHGVFDGLARNEDITVEVRHGRIRNDEPVAVMVQNQASFHFQAIGEPGGLGAPTGALLRFLAGARPFRLAIR